MALIECLECRREISDRAPACPHCGMPYSPQPPNKPAASTGERKAPEVLHVKHDDRSGFSKGIERGMEQVGTSAATGLVWIAVIVCGVLALGVIFGIRQSVVCPDCNGKGSSYGVFDCGTCDGTGYRK